jgi:outer membrane lipoprotein-sorting protein
MIRRFPIAFLLLTLTFCSSVFSEDAAALFHRMQEALGGADKIAAIGDFEQQVRAQSWNGRTGDLIGDVRKRTRWIRPNQLRVDQIGPGSTYVLYCDGASGWEILPGTQSVTELAGGELTFALGYVQTFRLRLWLADRDQRWRITSPAPSVIRMADGDPAHQQDIRLDAGSLPSKTSTTSLSDPAHPTRSEEVVTEWETVQGIRFPRRWTVYREGKRVAEATVDTTRVNGGLKLADLQTKPDDLKPVLLVHQGN